MKNEKLRTGIVICDLLDTLQTYQGAEKTKSGTGKEFYLQETARSYGMSVDKMKQEIPVEVYLNRTADLIETKELKPMIIPGMRKVLNFFGYYDAFPTIYSADLDKGAKLAAGPLIREGFVKESDVHGILDLGSKSDSKTWKDAYKKHDDGKWIGAILEDSVPYARAAASAYSKIALVFCHGKIVQGVDRTGRLDSTLVTHYKTLMNSSAGRM